MRAGDLRHRIVVDEPIESRTPSGAEIITWLSAGEYWARVESLSGREVFRANQVSADTDTLITMRWSIDVDRIAPKWRVQFDGRIYDIKYVDHSDHNHRMLQLLCSSGLNRG